MRTAGSGVDSSTGCRTRSRSSPGTRLAAVDPTTLPTLSGPPTTAICLAGFLDALRLTAPHLLGLSWGSALALGLYERHPDAVASLVLASAYAGWAGSLPPEEVQRRTRQVLREVELPPEQFVGDWLPTLLTASAPQELVDEVLAIMCDFHPAGTRTAVLGMAAADYRAVLPTITVPTLLLYGEADVRSPLSVAAELHAQIPRSTLVVLPGAPHLAQVEAPDAFNDAVLSFLGRIQH